MCNGLNYTKLNRRLTDIKSDWEKLVGKCILHTINAEPIHHHYHHPQHQHSLSLPAAAVKGDFDAHSTAPFRRLLPLGPSIHRHTFRRR